MSQAKHTPGPWDFYTKPQPNGCPIVGARGLMVAMLAHSINYEDQKQVAIANARLISAAPELLEALILLEAEMVASGNANATDFGWPLAIQKTRAAIAKATGEAQ